MTEWGDGGLEAFPHALILPFLIFLYPPLGGSYEYVSEGDKPEKIYPFSIYVLSVT